MMMMTTKIEREREREKEKYQTTQHKIPIGFNSNQVNKKKIE